MDIKSICAAAFKRQPPVGMTLAEMKLYYSMVLVYALHRLGEISVDEGKEKKEAFIEAYRQELEAIDLMKKHPDMKCSDVLNMLYGR